MPYNVDRPHSDCISVCFWIHGRYPQMPLSPKTPVSLQHVKIDDVGDFGDSVLDAIPKRRYPQNNREGVKTSSNWVERA